MFKKPIWQMKKGVIFPTSQILELVYIRTEPHSTFYDFTLVYIIALLSSTLHYVDGFVCLRCMGPSSQHSAVQNLPVRVCMSHSNALANAMPRLIG